MPKNVWNWKKLGLINSDNSIKAGDVLLFGNDEYKYHAAIAISRTEALEAYRHYEDENCTGMPILTRLISEIRRLYKNEKLYVIDFLQKKILLMEKNIWKMRMYMSHVQLS